MHHFSVIALIVAVLFGQVAHGDPGACRNLFETRCSIVNGCAAPEIMDYLTDAVAVQVKLDGAKVDELNNLTLKHLNEKSTANVSEGRKSGLNSGEISDLYRRVNSNSVASLAQYNKYDPQNKGIGFCFGRAMTAHLEALWGMGLDQTSIRKMWAVGELTSGGTSWRYHVTTVVRGVDGNWYAIDPIFGKPMKAEEWYAKMRTQYDSNQTMVLFESEAKRFGPTGNNAYDKPNLNNQGYNNFFVDLLNDFKARRTKGEI